jgi:MFS family permease
VRRPLFYGWIVVAISFVTMGIGVNARTAFSLFFPPILAEFGWERGLTAGAFSFGFIASMAVNPTIGRVMDRWGVRPVMLGGALLTAAGLALAPLTRAPAHLYLTLGVLVAAGTTCLGYTGHGLFLSNWFVRRRGMATGIAFSGVGVGAIVILPWLQSLIVGSGWRVACWAMAALIIVTIVPLNLFQRTTPESMGLAPDGVRTGGVASARRALAANVVDVAWVSIDWTLGRALRAPRFWWVALAFFTSLFAWYAVQVHQTKYLIEIGFPPAVAAWALGAVGLAGVLGQIVLGHLSDRIGREWIWTIGCAGFVVCYADLIVLRTHPTPALLYVMVGFQGVLGSGLSSIFGAIPAELFQGPRFGTIFGTLSGFAVLGAGVGPWVAGALHDHTGTYDLAFGMAIACSAVSAGAMWLAAPGKVRAVAGRVPRSRL